MPRRTPVRELQTEEVASSPLRRSSRLSNASPVPASVPTKVLSRRNSATELSSESTPTRVTRSRRSSFSQEQTAEEADKKITKPLRTTRRSSLSQNDKEEEESAAKRTTRRSSVSKDPIVEVKKPATRRRRSVSEDEEKGDESEVVKKTTRSRSASLTKKTDLEDLKSEASSEHNEKVATPVKKSPSALESIEEDHKESDSPVLSFAKVPVVKIKKIETAKLDLDLSVITETSLTEDDAAPLQEKHLNGEGQDQVTDKKKAEPEIDSNKPEETNGVDLTPEGEKPNTSLVVKEKPEEEQENDAETDVNLSESSFRLQLSSSINETSLKNEINESSPTSNKENVSPQKKPAIEDSECEPMEVDEALSSISPSPTKSNRRSLSKALKIDDVCHELEIASKESDEIILNLLTEEATNHLTPTKKKRHEGTEDENRKRNRLSLKNTNKESPSPKINGTSEDASSKVDSDKNETPKEKPSEILVDYKVTSEISINEEKGEIIPEKKTDELETGLEPEDNGVTSVSRLDEAEKSSEKLDTLSKTSDSIEKENKDSSDALEPEDNNVTSVSRIEEAEKSSEKLEILSKTSESIEKENKDLSDSFVDAENAEEIETGVHYATPIEETGESGEELEPLQLEEGEEASEVQNSSTAKLPDDLVATEESHEANEEEAKLEMNASSPTKSPNESIALESPKEKLDAKKESKEVNEAEDQKSPAEETKEDNEAEAQKSPAEEASVTNPELELSLKKKEIEESEEVVTTAEDEELESLGKKTEEENLEAVPAEETDDVEDINLTQVNVSVTEEGEDSSVLNITTENEAVADEDQQDQKQKATPVGSKIEEVVILSEDEEKNEVDTSQTKASLPEIFATNQRRSSFTMQENLKAGEEKNVREQIHKVVDMFCAGIKNKDVKLNVSLEYTGQFSDDSETESAINDVLQVSLAATAVEDHREEKVSRNKGSKRRKIDAEPFLCEKTPEKAATEEESLSESKKKKKKRKAVTIETSAEDSFRSASPNKKQRKHPSTPYKTPDYKEKQSTSEEESDAQRVNHKERKEKRTVHSDKLLTDLEHFPSYFHTSDDENVDLDVTWGQLSEDVDSSDCSTLELNYTADLNEELEELKEEIEVDQQTIISKTRKQKADAGSLKLSFSAEGGDSSDDVFEGEAESRQEEKKKRKLFNINDYDVSKAMNLDTPQVETKKKRKTKSKKENKAYEVEVPKRKKRSHDVNNPSEEPGKRVKGEEKNRQHKKKSRKVQHVASASDDEEQGFDPDILYAKKLLDNDVEVDTGYFKPSVVKTSKKKAKKGKSIKPSAATGSSEWDVEIIS